MKELFVVDCLPLTKTHMTEDIVEETTKRAFWSNTINLTIVTIHNNAVFCVPISISATVNRNVYTG